MEFGGSILYICEYLFANEVTQIPTNESFVEARIIFFVCFNKKILKTSFKS